MALESCEVHYVEYFGRNYFLKKINRQWFHGNEYFDYELFGQKDEMDRYTNSKVKSLGLILPTKLTAFNSTETENEE